MRKEILDYTNWIKNLVLLSFVFSSGSISAQCPDQNETHNLKSQAEVDAFLVNNPECPYIFELELSGDISDSWFDIINLMKDLESSKNEFSMQFPSQTFWHYWEFKEIDDSKWEIRIYWGHNEKKTFRVQKGIFKKEFNKIIVRVESDLKKQGYKLSDFREYQ